MDLLASYADDTSDNQNLDVNEKAADSGMVFSHLEAEWESFEKMMGDDLLIKSTDKVSSDTTADFVEPDRKSAGEHPDPVRLSTGEECNSGQESVSSVNDDRSSSKSSASYDSESDSEENDKEEKAENKSDRKRHSSESSSSSSSSASDVSEASAGKVERTFPNVQAGSEKTSSDRGLSERKVAARRSRSRSHSLSPNRKRRRSSDRSVHHRSSTRHSHARHERKRISARRSRSRSRSRDRHTRRHSSRERRHYSNRDRRHRRSRSRDHHHRHRHHPGSGLRRGSPPHGDRRKPEVDKRRSRSRSSERKEGEVGEKKITPRNFGAGSGGGSGEGVVNETGARVTYRTAGIKFGHGPGTGKPQTFKEQMRQNLIKMWSENMASCSSGDPSSGATNQPNLMQLNPQSVFTNMPIQSAGLGVQALCTITPQMAFMQTVAAMQKKAEEITGITVPKYYNPAAVNPMKYAEQVQKRKLLWSKTKDKKESDNQWHAQALVADGDSKTAAKFRKLMGIKDGETKETVTTATASNEDDFMEEQRKKQEELFQQLDKEYHFARIATHTQRGAGLGFGSQSGSFH